jgi:hypothetical protein
MQAPNRKSYSSRIILHVNILFSILLAVAFLTRLSLPVTAMTIFRDHNYSKDVISINNRYVQRPDSTRRNLSTETKFLFVFSLQLVLLESS